MMKEILKVTRLWPEICQIKVWLYWLSLKNMTRWFSNQVDLFGFRKINVILFNALSLADTDNYLFHRLFLLIKVLQIWKKLFYTLSAKIVWKLNKLNAKPNYINLADPKFGQSKTTIAWMKFVNLRIQQKHFQNNSLKFLTSLSAITSL